MARGKKQIEGQLTFDFCLDSGNRVVQANSLVGGRQALKLNSAKLIRSAIMQVVASDEELKPYKITIPELAELLNINASNIYRDIDSITDDIIKNPVFIKQVDGKTVKWIKIPWVKRCEYNSDIGVLLQLNDLLKPFLINLKDHYTQYTLDTILCMKSVYAIRLYEMLESKALYNDWNFPKNGVDIEMDLQELKECLGCDSKSYDNFSDFRKRVIDVAVKEINEMTKYTLTYDYIKKGRSVTGLIYHFNKWMKPQTIKRD